MRHWNWPSWSSPTPAGPARRRPAAARHRPAALGPGQRPSPWAPGRTWRPATGNWPPLARPWNEKPHPPSAGLTPAEQAVAPSSPPATPTATRQPSSTSASKPSNSPSGTSSTSSASAPAKTSSPAPAPPRPVRTTTRVKPGGADPGDTASAAGDDNNMSPMPSDRHHH